MRLGGCFWCELCGCWGWGGMSWNPSHNGWNFERFLARAGKPCERPCKSVGSGVYFPVARGNLGADVKVSTEDSSIPARAGKPCSRPCRSRWATVYPRSRGATRECQQASKHHQGLSPLARGNRLCGKLGLQRVGSIPARAGKPIAPDIAPAAPTVYPRSRGATHARKASPRAAKGLSPLARGNLGAHVQRQA